MPVRLRSFQPGDQESIAGVVVEAFKGLEYLPRVNAALSSPFLNREASNLAEEDGSVRGCVALFRLGRENWFDIRFLAVRDADRQRDLVTKLVANTLEYPVSKRSAYVKATTIAVQPYVDVYKEFSFSPVRRIVRVGWDLLLTYPTRNAVATELLPPGRFEEALHAFISGLRPNWDWWIDEAGGPEAVPALFTKPTENETWIGVLNQGNIVGVAWFIRDFYGTGEARFQGAYVLPEARGMGIGSALMDDIIRRAQQLNQKKIFVYTFSYLDHLAPGTLLYLKSGGKIEAEYLQLQRV